MIRSLRNSLRQSLATALVCAAAATSPSIGDAGTFDCGSNIVPIIRIVDVDRDPGEPEEWCGWATHDSCPAAVLAGPPAPAISAPTDVTPTPLQPAEPIAEEFDSELVEIVPAADKVDPLSDRSLDDLPLHVQPIPLETLARLTAGGVPVRTWSGPLAMVGPFLTRPISDIDRLQAFWHRSIETAATLAERSSVPNLEADMEDLAANEPVDADIQSSEASTANEIATALLADEHFSHQSSTEPSPAEAPMLSVARIDPLAGSSAVVATIAEEYRPYDLADTDLPVWPSVASDFRPFCVRACGDGQDLLALVPSPTPDPLPNGDPMFASESAEQIDVTELIDAVETELARVLAEVQTESEWQFATQSEHSEPIDTVVGNVLDTVAGETVAPEVSDRTDDTVSNDVARSAALQASADCLLDEWLYRAQPWTEVSWTLSHTDVRPLVASGFEAIERFRSATATAILEAVPADEAAGSRVAATDDQESEVR